MSILKLIPRNIVRNEVDTTYDLSFTSSSEIKHLLSLKNVGGGVIGFENVRTEFGENCYFFSPPHFKVDWKRCMRNSLFDDIKNIDKNISLYQLYTEKQSMFPLNLNNSSSVWNIIKNIVPNHINILYQVVMLHKHDNWKEELQEIYHIYLNENIQTPSQNKLLRNIQVNISEKIDSLIKLELKNLPIDEFDRKINENGFRYSIRLCLIGGTPKERKRCLIKIRKELNTFSYLNKWKINSPLIYGDLLQNIQQRRLDKLTKSQVLCESEILPFVIINEEKIMKFEKSVEIEYPIRKENDVSNAIKLLSSEESSLREIDIQDISNKFTKGLRKTKQFKEDLEIKHSVIGATLVRITYVLPKGMKYSDLTKKANVEDIQVYSGLKNISFEQGENQGEFIVSIPLDERRKVFLKECIDTEEFRRFKEKADLPIIIGLGVDGEPIFKDLAKAPHLLVAGQTGSGKSKWINSLVITLMLSKSPKDVQFYMIDLKRVELSMYNGLPHVKKVITDANESISLLQQTIDEMNRRYELFEKIGVRDLEAYNKKSKKHLPRIVVLIDEYAELKLRFKNVDDFVQSLTQLSRASGIHLIVCTQRPSVDVISGIVKSNLNSKICFKCSNNRSYTTILNSIPKFNLLNNGDGIMDFVDESEEHIRFQGCLSTDGDEVELIQRIGKFIKENGEKLEETQEESELDKLKSVIIETGETRVSELRKIMKVNINKLNGLMKELVDEGFLERGISRQEGYKLIASQEEIDKYKAKKSLPNNQGREGK